MGRRSNHPRARLAACLLAIVASSAVWAQSNSPTPGGLTAEGVETGMSTAAALDLIGRAPDHEVEVGAGCGVLQIMSWNDSPLRIISVGGVVSSVAENAGIQAVQPQSSTYVPNP